MLEFLFAPPILVVFAKGKCFVPSRRKPPLNCLLDGGTRALGQNSASYGVDAAPQTPI